MTHHSYHYTISNTIRYLTLLCRSSPSRKSVMSGRFAFHVNDANMACAALPGRISTVADTLKAAGYKTHFIGQLYYEA